MKKIKRITAFILVCIVLITQLISPTYAVYTYNTPDLSAEDVLKSWSTAMENNAIDVGYYPSGLSQERTGMMGDTAKFWFEDKKGRTYTYNRDGISTEIDFSKFNHRYFACADSHTSGWFADVGSQLVLKKIYYPTDNIDHYPEFIQNLKTDMQTNKFILLMISMLSSAYETPSESELKDSDKTSMYYYLLWLSIWANDVYAEHGQFKGISPDADWQYVQDQLRYGLGPKLNPDIFGSTAIYDAFRSGGPAQHYFYQCWKAAKFLSSFDYDPNIGISLPVADPVLGDDGMYHLTYDYSGLSDYEKEVYRRLTAENLASGWEYTNDGSKIDFKSPDGTMAGNAIAVLKLKENSEEDHYYNCGFGVGGLAGFQGYARNDRGKGDWGNTQVYFSAVSEPLEILVAGKGSTTDPGSWKLEIHRYEHEEQWNASYNLQLRKYDSETGQPLAGSKWDILEAFDSSQLDATDLESSDNWANQTGIQFKKWEGWDYGNGNLEGDVANDPCPWDINVTNEDGLLMLGDNEENASQQTAHTDIKTYTYNKGYCGGHPEPEIEESGDEETDSENEADAMEAWQEEVDKCEALEKQGGFFHSLEEGEAQTMMETDRDSFYEQFISLKYDYCAVELKPRPGYTIHGSHPEDIPIEIKTVTSSEWKDLGHSGRATDTDTAPSAATPSRARKKAFREEAITPKPAEEKESPAATPSQAVPEEQVEELTEEIFPGYLEEDEEEWDEDYDNGEAYENEKGSSTPSQANPSNASWKKKNQLKILKALFEEPQSLIKRGLKAGAAMARFLSDGEDEDSGPAAVSFETSPAPVISPGRSDLVDHTFIVYDHRTEGGIQFNKQDLYLSSGSHDTYDSYGDSIGDGTLEGAVYGLFALKDIIHPDGHSGVVFQTDDLVSVAATDRNGNGSFLAVTEAPGSAYNYPTGTIEKRPGGFSGPDNLYQDKNTADAVSDMEQYLGHDSGGSPVSLTDSTPGTGNYRKHSSNQPGVEGLTGEFTTYPIPDNQGNNGNCWIGRPLIVEENGTPYYIKELSRSEGYELSVSGRTNLVTNGEDNQETELESADVTISPITLDIDKNGNYFTITGKNVTHDLTLTGLNFPQGAAFELSTIEKVPEKIQVPVYSTIKKPVMALLGSPVFKDGAKVEASAGDTVTYRNGQSYRVQAVSPKQDKTIGIKPYNYKTLGTPTVTDLHTGANAAAFQSLYNKELEKLGYKEPGNTSPWVRVKLNGNTDMAWLTAITTAIKARHLQYFNSLRITRMEGSGANTYAVLRYEQKLYGDKRDDGVYVPEEDLLYVKKDSGKGYFVYAPYENLETHPAVLAKKMKNGFLERATIKEQKVEGLTVEYPAPLPDTYTLKTQQTPSYWIYTSGEQERDDTGNLKYTEETTVTYAEQDGFRQEERKTALSAAYDEDRKTYTLTLPKTAFDTQERVSLKVSDDGGGKYSIKEAYINKSTFAYVPANQNDDTYISNVTLKKPSENVPYSYEQAYVLERPIMQKIKITKDLSINEEGKYENNTFPETGHEDQYTENGGGTEKNREYLKNFRFKTYLKSNLERLYRAEDGSITWQDRNGNPVDIDTCKGDFPEKVQKLYTKVDHETEPFTRDSNKGAIANQELYSKTDGLIHQDQNPGYTRILETVSRTIKDSAGGERSVSHYNYEKFFEAIYVANTGKWDDTDNKSSSFKPFAFIKKLVFGTSGGEKEHPAEHNNPDIKNSANTSEKAHENAACSDHVRQFAITWYLDEEVKKLVKENGAGENEGKEGSESYQEEIYDEALSEAIKKAENYLKPFFAYDLDKIYSIAWDSDTEGGKDKDFTTLSADQEDGANQYCYGISEYLPYGIYVAVEQQPYKKESGDFFNKHYQTDAPKEIQLPAVYEKGKEGADKTPEQLSSYYHYQAEETASRLAAKYQIRFNEEWPGETGEDLRKYVIGAQSYLGDYEIYKYGLDLDKLTGTGAGDPSGKGHFTITQGKTDPVKDYYNTIVDPEEEGGNPDSHYLADDANGGKTSANGSVYEADAIEKIYRYGSVSEDRQIYDSVIYPGSGEGEESYKDHVKAMEGMQTAYDGRYAPMLVPWSVTEPADETADMAPALDGRASYQGYAYRKYRNSFYKSYLRLEKLDSETGENILHDGALFALYAASREDGENTDGLVKFYKKDTLIKGSKEFLEAMGAMMITPAARALPPIGAAFTGVVPAGTPVCTEAEQVLLTDREGKKTGLFAAFTTTRDGLQAEEEDLTRVSYQEQNTGYLLTPEPLGAGTYVLCEIKPPAGYARTKPVAIEIYSDKVSYYLNGEQDNRVTAAAYEDPTGEGSQGLTDTARIYVGNTPIRLEVSKIKVPDQTVTYRTNTRMEGSEVELKKKYKGENLEFAYKNGTYLGYGWKKGTLEYLESRKAAGEEVEPVYLDGVFAGYGLITRALDTADDQNRYVAGANMTLYDAIKIKANGDSGDYGFDGVEVTRDRNNNVQSIKVLKGYAGTTVELIRKEDVEGSLQGEGGEGTWTYQTIERGTSDLLFYSLSGLKVTGPGTDGKVYGYDREGNRVFIKNQESIYVLKGGSPVFELAGGDLTVVKYSAADKCFTALSPETILYHLDGEGNREAMVHPTTGMAYVKETITGPDGKEKEKIFVWPVKVAKTAGGAVIAQEKIKTGRIASINADTDQEYTIGTYDGNRLAKKMNPVFNPHGLLEYYQISREAYTKGAPVYDIDGDYVRYKYKDLLPAFNRAAYEINKQRDLEEIGEEQDTGDDKKLHHRQGEAWIMENTWTTGEKYPNDPFTGEMPHGQADMLKRIFPGTYIMEEVKAPEGYAKSFPQGVAVAETTYVQRIAMEDEKIKAEIVKTDAADQYRLDVVSDYQEGLTVTEPKGSYSYGQVKGSHLILYKARRIPTTDYVNYPKGYYLEKAENKPAEWTVENPIDNTPVKVTADWITDGSPKYFEGIPAGDYILEEKEAASGYIRSSMDLEIKPTGEVQTFNLKNDHTKLEIYKYYKDFAGKFQALPDSHKAVLALYEAKTDSKGEIILNGTTPEYDSSKVMDRWSTTDLKEFTEMTEKSRKFTDRFKDFLGLEENKSSFLTEFEAGYRKKGEGFNYVTWHTKEGKRSAARASITQTGKGESSVQTWTTDHGQVIRVTIYRNVTNGSLDQEGKLPLVFEYQFNYKETKGIKSYDTLEGKHRIDYLPFHAEKEGSLVGNYVLVEEKVPEGFEAAAPKAIVITETSAVQRFSLENEEKYIHILKTASDTTEEYGAEGAKLTLYRADESGNLVEEEAYLVDAWVSGSDGRYTKEDQFKGNILEGLTVGDLKPHRINKIPYGTYYIVEHEAPDWLYKAEPLKIQVGAEKIPFYRVKNLPAEGRLELLKKASDTGEGLGNARFKVTNKETKATWYVTTGPAGKASLSGLPVGKVKPDGTVSPYTYTIEELSPPDLYQISEGRKEFQFDGTSQEKVISYRCTIENKPTEIRFKKTNFDTGMAVEGAEIAVYQAKAENGEYVKDGEAIETIISGKEGFTLKKKLSAGRVYIMEELKAPAGLVLSAPVIFTINKAGTGIRNVSNDFSVLKLASENGFIEALTVTGRVPVKVYTVLKDLDTGKELPYFSGIGTTVELTKDNGIIEGHLYEITEYTTYSDGKREPSRRETKRIYFDKEGSYSLSSRSYIETKNQLTDREGRVLAEWKVNEDNHEYTIKNPVIKEVPIVKVTGTAGADHKAVKQGSIMSFTITYTNPYNAPSNMRIKAVLSKGLEYMRSTENGMESEGIVVWDMSAIAPHETGTVEVIAAVTGKAGTAVQAYFQTKTGEISKETVLLNPIAPKGSVTIVNKLTGTGKDQTDSFTYHVRFTDKEGKVLLGYQQYDGSSKGQIKGEGQVTITGDGYLTFAGLPYGTRYEIVENPTDDYIPVAPQPEGPVSGEIVKDLQSAVFINSCDNKTLREILTARGSYCLTESTSYTDGQSLISGIYRFSLNGHGMVDNVDMEDRPVELYFSKIDQDTGTELAGGHYLLIDRDTGTTIYEFTKDKREKVSIPHGILIPGKYYIFREALPPEGYAWEKDIHFRVNEGGIPETIIMQDKQTEAEILKVDAKSKEAISGGRYTIRKEDGTFVVSFTSNGKPFNLKGKLDAGERYVLKEEKPPAGYAYARSISFTMPREAELIQVVMEDKKTEIIIEKLSHSLIISTPSMAERPLKDCILQILNEDKTPATAIREDRAYHAGEELIFTTAETGKVIQGQLEAGKKYWLHEVRPADGYAYAEDVLFTVASDGRKQLISMYDEPTRVLLSKKAVTGSEEFPGNYMSIEDQKGNVMDQWVSGEQPYEIVARLVAGETYYLCEIQPASGYAYGERVAFTVSMDGRIDKVAMRNKPTNIKILKINPQGNVIEGAVLRILDENGKVIINDFLSGPEPLSITGILEAGKNYVLHETKAPKGYLLSMDVKFCVPEDARLLSVIMTDIPVFDSDHEKPGPVPPNPEPEKSIRIGKITAFYDGNLLTPPWLKTYNEKSNKRRQEKTGDSWHMVFLTGGMITCLIGFTISIIRIRRYKNRKKK